MIPAAVEQTMPAVSAQPDQAVELAAVIPLRPARSEPAVASTDPAARIAELEARIADLEDRNRELASDLDNALDQLAGHALHTEQERLVNFDTWSPWPTSTREGYDR
ncbi:hypothetical protein [Nocardia mangyaensis]|uniref:hypothetical protein n=1 Tax=Nocardia mangyaensis TaxID=2213200 RepID=UPI002676AC16|nr:hypothetical protein [Nocardia mangyaensis]MDO3651184.1 hypothetical protein [Nocardia mangyaensis]